MKLGNIFLFSLLLGLVFSCKEQTTEAVTAEQTDFLTAMQDSMAVIDAMMDAPTCLDNSMDYGKENGERYFTQLYCDSLGTVLLMVENSIDKDGFYTYNKLYYNKEHLYATYSSFQQKENDSLISIEELTFYDAKGKVKSSYRKTERDNNMLPSDYVPSKGNKEIDDRRILQAMNRQGEFALTFQGFIKGEQQVDYIIVGEPKDDGFTSALQVQSRTPFIEDLYQHENEYVNRKMKVDFRRMSENGYNYQVFVAGSWE